jgi:hypothetical protein
MNPSDRKQRRSRIAGCSALQRSKTPTSKAISRLQNTVYREMYRLEAQQPGSEMGLALALLRVIVASQRLADREEFGDWLKEICPMALKMIEDGLDLYSECPPGPRSPLPISDIMLFATILEEKSTSEDAS